MIRVQKAADIDRGSQRSERRSRRQVARKTPARERPEEESVQRQPGIEPALLAKDRASTNASEGQSQQKGRVSQHQSRDRS